MALALNEQQLEQVFTEWDRRWRENPESFTDIVTHLTKNTPKSYGEACVPYFIKILKEIQGE